MVAVFSAVYSIPVHARLLYDGIPHQFKGPAEALSGVMTYDIGAVLPHKFILCKSG